jgi:adenylate kinase family enzyme
MRISIIGLPGSGKSTLAAAISKKLSIPHIHLDRFWFESGGEARSGKTQNLEEVRARVGEKADLAAEKESWVSDGFYHDMQPKTAERADIIIFLDIPLWQRLWNHLRRLPYRKDRHTEVSLWDDILFLRQIVRRTFTAGPKIRELVEEYKDKTITLRSRKEIRKYLQDLN